MGIDGQANLLRPIQIFSGPGHFEIPFPSVGNSFAYIGGMGSDAAGDDAIVQVLQKGYTLAERVLRPALVMVSSGQA